MPEVNIDIAEAMITLARKTRQDSLAEAYALKLINVAIDVDYLKPLMFAHRTLHDLYEQRALSEKAAMHLERYFELKDALDAREKANTDYFQSRALELAQKRHQIDVVEAQLQLQTHRTLIVTVVLLFTSILIIFLFLSRVDHKKNNKILSAKNAQIEEFNQSLVAINEQLNKARKKAEDSDRLKTSILQNMSHETRTPLTSILGYAEMIADNEGDNLEIAAHIKRGGRRLLDTLTSVLDLARLESGDAELKREVFNVATLVQESADTHKPVALNKGINFDVAVKDAAKLEVKADREAVKRVLNNVIHNAVHFTERGCVSILVERVAQDVILHVADTGIGMNTAFLPRAFEPFRQESMGHGRTHEGIGVGLSITKLLVELMNGRITVMSEKGKGSTFTVILPIGI